MRNNKEFQKLLDKLHNANVKYKAALQEAESAYNDRYGEPPTQNDMWVDSFHLDATKLTVKMVDDSFYNMPDSMPNHD